MWLIIVSAKMLQQFLINLYLSYKTVLVLLTFFLIYSLPRNNLEKFIANVFIEITHSHRMSQIFRKEKSG